MRRIAGPRHAQTFIFLEQAAISTTVLTKGYVAARGDLWGKKWVGLKPLFLVPTIAYFQKVTTQGHINEGGC
jgi:hypothetical protein